MNEESAPTEQETASPIKIALKFLGITALIIGWSLALALPKAFGISLGALPAMIISAPFIYAWWKLFNAPGGKVAMLFFVLFILAGILIIILLVPS